MRQRPEHDPYRLMKYVAVAAGDGIAAGWTCVLALLWLDVAGLGTLVHGPGGGLTPLIVLLVSFGVTFGFVGIAWRVMVMLPDEE